MDTVIKFIFKGLRRTKPELLITILAVSATVPSCSKESFPESFPEEATVIKIKNFELLSQTGNDTRTTISGTDIKWMKGDEIQYYTGRTKIGSESADRLSAMQSTFVSSATPTASFSFPVKYNDGDSKVVFVVKGTTVGEVTSKDFTSATIKNAIPKNQSGTFEGSNLGVASTLLTGSSVAVAPVQAFVSFNMSSLVFGGKEVNLIKVVGGKAGDKLCGDVKVSNIAGAGGAATANVVTYPTAPSGTEADTVYIDKSKECFVKNTTYYVALRSGVTYANGLKFILYNVKDGKTTRLGDVYAKTGITLTKGAVLNIGTLNSHFRIASQGVEIMPPYAAFTEDMTKKLWVRVYPDDWEGTISLTSSNTAVVQNNTTDIYASTPATETIDGVKYYVYVIHPKNYSNPTRVEKEITITAKATGKDGTEMEGDATLLIGNFIYMGANVTYKGKECRLLWARSYMTGNWQSGYDSAADDEKGLVASTLALAANSTDAGNLYQFGYLNHIDGTGRNSNVYTRWGGTWVASDPPKSTDYGGKYNDFDKKDELEEKDDVAWRWDNTCRIPSIGDCETLLAACNSTYSYTKSTYGVYTWTSIIRGFTDMRVVNGSGQQYSGTGLTMQWANIRTREAGGTSQRAYGICMWNNDDRGCVAWGKQTGNSVKPVRYVPVD